MILKAIPLLVLFSGAVAQVPPGRNNRSFESFEVATIKLVKPEDVRAPRYIRMESAHRFIVKNTTVSGMIAAAFNLNQNMISGGPEWMTAGRFDVVALTPGDERPTLDDQMRMLRRLLTERFKLTFRTEKKKLPVYVLTVAKGGSRLSPDTVPQDQSPLLTPTLFPAASGGIDHVLIRGRNATVPQLASILQRAVTDRPVIDNTGMQGRYNFDLEWTPDDSQFGGTLPFGAPDSGKPGLYTAIEQQLGLMFNSTKRDVETLIVEGLEQPSGN
ncbi:MAG TPA: TIGR03435 family protein [Bryobacteraceae bacterium]|nr:TIGR03435 family protein [Bryobacteraceae bacterium]